MVTIGIKSYIIMEVTGFRVPYFFVPRFIYFRHKNLEPFPFERDVDVINERTLSNKFSEKLRFFEALQRKRFRRSRSR